MANIVMKRDGGSDNVWHKEYKVQDHLGSTRIVLDESGSIIGQYDYEPFGKVVTGVGSVQRLSYIDKEKDEESGLGDYGVRKYADGYGRFMSIDPLWEKYRSLSPYNYSANNPLIYTDPSGMAYNITGPDNQAAFNELQSQYNVPMALNGNSVTLTNSNYVAQNPAEQKLMDAISSPTITVNLHTTTSNEVQSRDGSMANVIIGLYDGSSVDANGNVTADNYINMEHARRADLVGGGTMGQSVMHETLEAFVGAQLNPGVGFTDVAFNAAHSATLAIDPLPALNNDPQPMTQMGANIYEMGVRGANGRIGLYGKNFNTGQYFTVPDTVTP